VPPAPALSRAGASGPKGLTTAASIWAAAAVGVAIGGGSYLLAVGTTVLVVLPLYAWASSGT
jgi:uncharacterized membrane protein YhiD involved in acid resistance